MASHVKHPTADAALMRSAIQRVATGPELSKNLSRDEAHSVMLALLDGSADPVQAGVFLIGLRMKRETDEELKGVMDALDNNTKKYVAAVDEVVSISDPYNGFNRTLQGSLFVLPVLAACGMNVYSHGVALGGPKFGSTHHSIIKALGGNPLRSTSEVSERISNSDIGWGYIDQATMCPSLHSLNPLRVKIVKRPVLSTTEGLLSPISGIKKTHLVTGYVHKPYRDTYCMAHLVRYDENSDYEELDINLSELGLLRDYRAEEVPDNLPLAESPPAPIGMKWDIDALSSLCATRGREALSGQQSAVMDACVLGAGLIMWHTGFSSSLTDATDRARKVIASGKALDRLEAGL